MDVVISTGDKIALTIRVRGDLYKREYDLDDVVTRTTAECMSDPAKEAVHNYFGE